MAIGKGSIVPFVTSISIGSEYKFFKKKKIKVNITLCLSLPCFNWFKINN